MGIRCTLYQITQGDIERIRADPGVIDSILDEKRYAFSRPPGTETQLLMFGLPARPRPTSWYAYLDKRWQAVHFLLNGHPSGGHPPLSLAILGGEPVEATWDSFKILERREVREIADALITLSREELYRRSDPAQFAAADIYAIDPDLGREEIFEELIVYFDRLAAVYLDAKRCDNAILIQIC